MCDSMINIKNASEFERLLKGLSDDIVDAHIHYLLYEDLVRALDKHPLVAPQSNVFWTFTLQAHLNSSIYTLFRAYDQDLRALHLRSWLLTIQSNIQLFEVPAFRERLKNNPHVDNLAKDRRPPDANLLAQDISACSSSDPIVKKLTIYRGSRIAHRNAKSLLSARDLGDVNGLTFDDIRVLLDRAITILNRYSYLLSAAVYSTNVVGRDDYEYIFKSVEDKVEAARREW
jgi:HEPN superfamily AbiU2-like protein